MGILQHIADIVRPARHLAGRNADPETEIEVCLRDHVRPALETVRDQLASEGYETALEDTADGGVELRVINFNDLPLVYRVHGKIYKQPVVNLSSMSDPSQLRRFSRIEIESGGSTREYRTGRCHREAIERAVFKYYRKFLMRTPEDG